MKLWTTMRVIAGTAALGLYITCVVRIYQYYDNAAMATAARQRLIPTECMKGKTPSCALTVSVDHSDVIVPTVLWALALLTAAITGGVFLYNYLREYPTQATEPSP